jgi:AMP deaminase
MHLNDRSMTVTCSYYPFYQVREIIHNGNVTSYSFKRLEILAALFNLHLLLNQSRENDVVKSVPHRDFYNVRKVDTHVHHSACMNQKHLLRLDIRYNHSYLHRDCYLIH